MKFKKARSERPYTSTYIVSPANRSILGYFWNEHVCLSLTDLPEYFKITISFNLYLIRTRDGWNDMFDPDIFGLRVVGGPELLHAM
ncbi:MAG: hypothetical protein ACYTBX_03865 [Planctomycetota bacterium]|jgi:hypothetical protein